MCARSPVATQTVSVPIRGRISARQRLRDVKAPARAACGGNEQARHRGRSNAAGPRSGRQQGEEQVQRELTAQERRVLANQAGAGRHIPFVDEAERCGGRPARDERAGKAREHGLRLWSRAVQRGPILAVAHRQGAAVQHPQCQHLRLAALEDRLHDTRNRLGRVAQRDMRKRDAAARQQRVPDDGVAVSVMFDGVQHGLAAVWPGQLIVIEAFPVHAGAV